MDALPSQQLPPVKSAQHALKTKETGGALQKRVTNEAAPASPNAPVVQASRPAPTGISEGAQDIIVQHRRAARPAPTIPEGEMTLAALAAYAGAAESQDEDSLDESAGWNTGKFLKERTTQVRRVGPNLAAAAISRMAIRK